jgi:hypothetical protein
VRRKKNNNKQSRGLAHTITTVRRVVAEVRWEVLHLASSFVLSVSISSEDTQSPADPEFSSCTRMPVAHHSLSGASRATCPQELIDLILGETDSADLASCALVARSFRPTSQKLIFSDLTILPPGRDNIPALQRLADVFSASPHLALHVRTLHLVQPSFYERCVWIQSDIPSAILSVFTNLESLNIRVYKWDHLHSDCEQAIYALITRSPLSSIEVEGARLETDARLLSLLRCLPASLESVSFLSVFADDWSSSDELQSTPAELRQLRLASLRLDSYTPMLFQWAIRAVDPKCLRHLYTMVKDKTMDDVQELLHSALEVETYHLSFWSSFCACFHIFYRCFRQINLGTCYIAHQEIPDLSKMQGLRTLEISVKLDWDEIVEVGGQGRHNPLNDAMRTLDTAPHSVEHLILNLKIYNPDQLSHFMEYSFEDLGEDRSALRDVVVRIVSCYGGYSSLQRGIRYLEEEVFYWFHERGMLTAMVVHPPSLN